MRFRLIGACSIALLFLIPMVGIPWSLPPFWQWGLATLVQFGFGYPFYVGAFEELKNLRPGMDILVTLGISAAYGYSVYQVSRHALPLYFDASVLLVALISLGHYLEHRATHAARAEMTSLLQLQPQRARKKWDETWRSVDIAELKKGDIVQVRPAELIPADGVLLSGQTTTNEAMMTGESRPIPKKAGDWLLAGTLNGQGLIEFKVTRTGEDTALGKILKLVEGAVQSKTPVQKLADGVAAYFVPFVILVALATFFVWWGITHALHTGIFYGVSVVIVACPCALGLAIPIVLRVVLGTAARQGILIKNAVALQNAAQIEEVYFDKTGTLTQGALSIVKTVGDVRLAAALAQHSKHPLSQAIARGIKGLAVRNLQDIPGLGVTGEVEGKSCYLGSARLLRENNIPVPIVDTAGTIIYFGNADTQGYIVLRDTLRQEAQETITTLHALGIKGMILSGDRQENVMSIAQEIGVDAWHAEMSPQAKIAYLKKRQEKGKKIAMVGDGVNDAPALVQADVGFAMGQGTDVAMESASIGLLQPQLTHIPLAIRLSRMGLSKMKQNLGYAFVYNAVGLALAAFGLLTPVISALAMALSSVSVVCNALLLKRQCKTVLHLRS